jgi:signal transduction histidine kinase
MDNNKSALGFSLSSNSILRKAMNKSRDSGNIIASSFIPSINKKESALDLLVLYPHYRGGRVPETLVKRREMLEGFIVSVYRMEKVIEEIIQKKKAKGLNLVVYENARNNDKKNVYGNLLNDQAMELIFPVNIIGHPWLLVWQGSKNYKGGLGFKLSVVSSGAVFAVFFLLATIFEMNLIRTRVIKQEVEQRTAELYRANRDLAQFANIASHDLKAPLRGIAHLSRWIQDDLGENITDEVRGNLDRLVESVKKMDALIRGILEYSRAGKGSSEVKTIRVGSMIREILGLVGVGEDVDVDIQPDMPVFLTDSIKLSQVFSNLISNAIKHNSNENKKTGDFIAEERRIL